MTIDLTTASVRPAGTSGTAARTAAGFVVLTSDDGADLVPFIDAHQRQTDLIAKLAERIVETQPRVVSMFFTAGGQPYLLAWGSAVADVTSTNARFTVSPVPGQVLVHPISIDADGVLTMRDGDRGEVAPGAPINLTQGSIIADSVVVDLAGRIPEEWQVPDASTMPLLDRTPPDPAQVEASLVEASLAEDSPETLKYRHEELSLVVAAAQPPAAASFDGGQPAAEGIVFADDTPAGAVAAPPSPVASSPVAPVAPSPVTPKPANGASRTAIIPPPMPEDAPLPQVPPQFQPDTEPGPQAAPVAVQAPVLDTPPPPSSQPGPVMVLGVVCARGHHNHPQATFCSQCGVRIGEHQTTVLVNGPRPALGVLVVDDGTTVSIERDLIMGRDPASHPDVRSGLAGAMVMPDDSLALSRRHARIILDEWSVIVSDLGSSNGTWLNRGPNPQEWARVEAGTAVQLEPGDRLRLGSRLVQVELHHLR
ncbi:MAG: FHA domain-containing protein [Actinomycetota bacterium]